MALTTWLWIETEDAQGYQDTLKLRIKPAALGSTTLPTAAKIDAVIASVYGNTVLSTNIVKSYSVVVTQDTPTDDGGTGGSPTSEALRTRSEVSTNDFIIKIPGLNKANVSFDSSNPNAVVVTGTMFQDVRDALTDSEIAVSAPEGAYAAVADSLLLQTAVVYDGRRAPLKPR